MKKLNRRKFLSVASMGAGAAALAACAPPPMPTSAPPAAPPKAANPTQAPAANMPAVNSGATELSIAWWGSQDRHDRTIKVIELYQKKNPGVKITYEFSNFNDHLTKMTTKAAGNSLPDIMQQDYAWIAEWAKRGLIIPLEGFTQSGELDLKDCADDLVKGGRVAGKLVAVNLGANSQVFALDQGVWEKAGLQIPKFNWSWDDAEKAAATIKEKTGQWGFGGGLGGEQLWKSLYLAFDKWAFTDDGTSIGYEDDGPFIAHLDRLLRMQKAGTMPTRAEDIATYDGKSVEQQALATGKAGGDAFWSNQVVAVQKAAGDGRTIKLVPLPRPQGAKSSNYIKPSQFFSITRDSKVPKEAAKFISFFTNDIEANDILFAERGVPIATKVRESMNPKLGKSQKEMFEYVTAVGKDVQPIRPADPPGYADLIKNVYTPQVLDAVMYEKIKPAEGAALLRKEVVAILSKNKK